jgi:hypothetical protein
MTKKKLGSVCFSVAAVAGLSWAGHLYANAPDHQLLALFATAGMAAFSGLMIEIFRSGKE